MNIVILDAYAMNPGDLSWDAIDKMGELTIYERTSPDQIIERAKEADILLTNKVVLSKEIMAQLPNLKFICVLATGFNVVDTVAARRQNIVVSNVPAYSTMSVAQVVFAHLLNLTHHVGEHALGVRDGQYVNSPDFAYWNFPLTELDGLKLGIIGYGQTGKAVIRIAQAFGMKILLNTRTKPEYLPEGIELVDLNTLFSASDAISLHCPLTPETQGLVNAERLSGMKKTAFVINTSRGPVVDEQALADALNNEVIAGAGVDVLGSEPPKADCPLINAKNCYITPHFAWASGAARIRLMQTVVKNVEAFIDAEPVNVVN
ncbi:MAG: D-2-hydroxyacid dehydrogenase [Bacteroidales bacterium]|nr:D-2-hydroxyacid dehydrogenase [Bacteroidales bacterium]